MPGKSSCDSVVTSSSMPPACPQPLQSYRRDLRASTVTNSNSLKYDAKYHPLDDFTKPAAANKRRRLHHVEPDGKDERGSSIVSDGDTEELDGTIYKTCEDSRSSVESMHWPGDTVARERSDILHSAEYDSILRMFFSQNPQFDTAKVAGCVPASKKGAKSPAKKKTKKAKASDGLDSQGAKTKQANNHVPKLIYYKSFDDLCKKNESAWLKLARDEDLTSKLKRKSSSYISAWETFAEQASNDCVDKQDDLANVRDAINNHEDTACSIQAQNQYVYDDDQSISEHEATERKSTAAHSRCDSTEMTFGSECSPRISPSTTSTTHSSASSTQASSPPKTYATYSRPIHSHVNPQMLLHSSIGQGLTTEEVHYGPWTPPASATIVSGGPRSEPKQTSREPCEEISATSSFLNVELDAPLLNFDQVPCLSQTDERLARFGVVRSRPSSSGHLWDPAA